jgi:ABC-2 type transport system permease protein
MTSLGLAARFPRWRKRTRPLAPGIAAIVVKELRGRMRGRRTFAIVTLYLVLLSGFGWMLQRMNEEQINLSACRDFGQGCSGIGFAGQIAPFASAAVGQGIYVGLMMLLTLIVAVLAPASTAGAISGERERQTLDLLAVTPISSLAIVLGKLFSALAWVFVLILASIPVTALVFVFGGVAPDDVARGYVILLATAVGMGSIGLFFSALVRRTGASTGLTYVVTLALTVGTIFAWEFLHTTASRSTFTGFQKAPPEAILYFNPFIAHADVACGTQGGFGTWCTVTNAVFDGSSSLLGPILSGNTVGVTFDKTQAMDMPAVGGVLRGGNIGFPDVTVSGVPSSDAARDRLWPKTVASFAVLSVVLTVLSIQLVTPSRRWRPGLAVPVSIRRLFRRPRRDA